MKRYWKENYFLRLILALMGIVEGVDYRICASPYDFLRFDQVCALGGMEYLMDLDRYMTTLRAITRCEIITFPRSLLKS